MIIDCFTFFNELDLLDLRLHEHWDFVDKFVILEGDRTYPGKKYDSNFLKNYDRFKWAKKKIIHKIAPLKEFPVSRWENEQWQRDYWGEVYRDFQGSDYILQGCVDELYRKDTILDIYKTKLSPVLLVLDEHYYYLNSKDSGTNQKYPCPIAMFKKDIDCGTDAMWKKRYDYPQIDNAGWHFSYCGGAEIIKEKLENYSHAENDTDVMKDPVRIKDYTDRGIDLFDRPIHDFSYVEIDETFPRYLQKHQNKYRRLIK